MPGHLEQLRGLVVDRDAGLSRFLRDRRRNAAVRFLVSPWARTQQASSRRAEDLIVLRGRWCLTMRHWRKRRCSAPFVANMVFIARVRREYHDQTLPTPGCFPIVCYSLARRSNACGGEPKHGDSAKERPIQLLAVRMSFWPLRWMMFSTSQSYVGSERNGRDLRQRGLLARRNRSLVRAKSNCDVVSVGRRRSPYRARERRRPPLRIKRPARRSPRAGLPGIGQSGYLRQSGPIQARWDERPSKAGRRQAAQRFCIFLCPKPRG